MPYKEKEIEKLYWSISEVSEMLGLSQSQLRFWEKEFDNFNLKKNKKGDRFYTTKDIESLKMIKYLLKEKQYTIKGAKEKLKANTETSEQQFQTVETLKKIREFLVQLKDNLWPRILIIISSQQVIHPDADTEISFIPVEII